MKRPKLHDEVLPIGFAESLPLTDVRLNTKDDHHTVADPARLFLSRAAWVERLGALGLMIIGMFATSRLNR
jgi:hypothetical protein